MTQNYHNNKSVIELKTEISAIKKDISDLKKIILSIKQAKSRKEEDQDLKKIEENIATMS